MKLIKWLKWFVVVVGVALFVLLGLGYSGMVDEYDKLSRLRDFEFMRRMLDYDEGEVVQFKSTRSYHNDNGSYAYITLQDGQIMFMTCLVELGNAMYGGYNDGYYYVAKIINGDWQIRRQRENVLRQPGMPPRVPPTDGQTIISNVVETMNIKKD